MFSSPPLPVAVTRRWKPNVETAPNCPRCDSSNTKFCYYNNYSLAQPRYFCKGCRRYWTKGGSLRNVPVGGGCRKNRLSKSVRLSTGTDTPESNPDPISSLRPDLVLEEMVGSSLRPVGPSTIDLAVLYSKFLNQNPEPADSSGEYSFELIGSDVFGYPFQESSMGMPVESRQAPEQLQNALCPFRR